MLKENRRIWKGLRERDGRPDLSRGVVLTQSEGELGVNGAYALASVVAKAEHAKILFFTDPPQNRPLRRSFPYAEHFRKENISDTLEETVQKDTETLFQGLKEPKELLELHYKGLRIGDLVYDTVLRYGKNWQATVWKIDNKVFDVLYKAVSIVNQLEYVFQQYKVVATVFNHKVGLKGLPLRFAANKGVKAICGNLGFGAIRKYLTFDGRMLPYNQSLPYEFIEELFKGAKKDELVKEGETLLYKRLYGDIKDKDASNAYRGKRVFEKKKEFCQEFGLPTGRPVYFVMLHAFNDMPHHFERNLFQDYYHWFIETLKIVRDNREVNWVFKEHPSAYMYPNDANLSGIFEILNEPHIAFLDENSDFSTLSLKNLADGVITCIGTAGIEMSCLGIPVILASESDYSGFGFTYEPNSVEEYKYYLEQINTKLRFLEEEEKKKAKILFYIQYNFLFGFNDNNNKILPQNNQERLKGSVEELIGKVVEGSNEKGVYEFLDELEHFIIDDSQEIFFRFDWLKEVQRRINS
ncbi:MAG: hypothetical protein ABEH43_00630 [Flavobacteriales bacterium]